MDISEKNNFDMQKCLDSLLTMLLHNLEAFSNSNDADPLDVFEVCSNFRGKLPFFQQIQTRLYPGYYDSPIQIRARVAIALSKRPYNSPDVFWAALGDIGGSELNQTYTVISPNGDYQVTLLSRVAVRFGSSLFEPIDTPSMQEIFVSLYTSKTERKN